MHWHRRRRKSQSWRPLHVMHWHLRSMLLLWVLLILLSSMLLWHMLMHRHCVCRRHALHLRLLSTGSLLHGGCLPTGSTLLLSTGCQIQVCYVGTMRSPALPSRTTAREVDILELNAWVV
jgi:hypothetical protein